MTVVGWSSPTSPTSCSTKESNESASVGLLDLSHYHEAPHRRACSDHRLGLRLADRPRIQDRCCPRASHEARTSHGKRPCPPWWSHGCEQGALCQGHVCILCILRGKLLADARHVRCHTPLESVRHRATIYAAYCTQTLNSQSIDCPSIHAGSPR